MCGRRVAVESSSEMYLRERSFSRTERSKRVQLEDVVARRILSGAFNRGPLNFSSATSPEKRAWTVCIHKQSSRMVLEIHL